VTGFGRVVEPRYNGCDEFTIDAAQQSEEAGKGLRDGGGSGGTGEGELVKGYLVLDFDSTFVKVEALDELARIALRDVEDRDVRVARIEELTRDGMEGKIGFGESLAKRLGLFSAGPAHLKELVTFLRGQISASVRENRKFFEQNADRIYVMSGGFREYIVPVVEEFGIRPEHVIANTFLTDESGNVTGCDTGNYLAQNGGKVKALKALALDGPVAMVGDGFSDLQTRVQGVASMFVAFTENVDRPAVTAAADAVAENFGDVIEAVSETTQPA
jgi:D-3-phosphoglycerate dehydrogenase